MHLLRMLVATHLLPVLALAVNFNAPRLYENTTSDPPTPPVVADLNGDGKPDIVSPAYTSYRVLLNNGDGTFRELLGPSTDMSFILVAAGDFNGDGKPDLAIAFETRASQTAVSIWTGNGDGTFSPGPVRTAGASGTSGPSYVTVADFNGDGKLDVAIANGQVNNVAVLLGNGDGTLRAPVFCAAQKSPSWIAAGDFNGDGLLDMAVTNFTSNNVSILLGNGDGTFRAAVN